MGAVLLSHRMFLFPSFGPILYNVFIILGGIVAGKQFGIASLAYGALIGAVVGPFLVNAIGAARIGTGYRPSFDLKNAAFREWVRLSIPLMLGVSLLVVACAVVGIAVIAVFGGAFGRRDAGGIGSHCPACGKKHEPRRVACIGSRPASGLDGCRG